MNRRDPTDAPSMWYCNIAGSAYLAIGVVGFAMTGGTELAAPEGVRLLILEVNPLHNLLHVLLGGALLVAGSRSATAAAIAALTTAAALGAAALLGLAITGWTTPLALNTADNIVHLVTAATAAAAWFLDRRTRPRPTDVTA